MVAVEAAGADAPRTERLAYSGRRVQLYRIFLTNLGLSIVTLTIYRFWARARMRRYLWGQMAFQGDRFEWTGTGGEMFRAFLIAAGVLLVLALPLTMLQLLAPEALAEISMVQTLYLLALLFLGFAASFWALRYRLSRTRWRGIRGTLTGSAWGYAWRAFGWMILTLVTFGLVRPLADVALARYRIDRLSVGDARARCSARSGGLYGRYIAAWCVAWIATVASIGVFMVLFWGGIVAVAMLFNGSFDQYPGHPDTDASIVAIFTMVLVAGVAGYLLVVLIWILCFAAYRASLARHIASTTEVAGLRFALTFRTVQLLRLVIGNVFITVFTLGLGTPIVLDRKARFLARHLEVQGALDGAMLGQTRDPGPKRGEGLIDLLDLGAV